MTNNLKYFAEQLESAPESYTILRDLIEENKLDMVLAYMQHSSFAQAIDIRLLFFLQLLYLTLAFGTEK